MVGKKKYREVCCLIAQKNPLLSNVLRYLVLFTFWGNFHWERQVLQRIGVDWECKENDRMVKTEWFVVQCGGFGGFGLAFFFVVVVIGGLIWLVSCFLFVFWFLTEVGMPFLKNMMTMLLGLFPLLFFPLTAYI